MATKVYKTKVISLIDGTQIEIKPLKLKYLRKVMDIFHDRDATKILSNEESLDIFIACAYESMQQFLPDRIQTIADVEDNFDMDTLYDLLEYSAGLKLKKDPNGDPDIQESRQDQKGSGWEDLDLAALEAEVFIVGKWSDFEELESNLSLTEMLAILSSKRELEYNEKKFLAALQGVDLDKGNSNSAQNKWEEMKARVFSKGATSDPNDILSLQGIKAEQLGFGIGFGLDYDNQLPTKPDSV